MERCHRLLYSISSVRRAAVDRRSPASSWAGTRRGFAQGNPPSRGVPFNVTVPASLEPNPVDGRILLIVARTNDQEPRFQVGRGLASQPTFGIDVDGLRPGQAAIIDAIDARVGPSRASARSRRADYWVQAVLNVYTTFHRADGQPSRPTWINGKASTGTARRAISTAGHSVSRSVARTAPSQ